MSTTTQKSFKSLNPQSIQYHAATFQLISNLELWHYVFYYNYTPNPNPAADWKNKSYAILQATIETLSREEKLRVKRVTGHTGLAYERERYHEMQILDQNQKVIETLIGSIASTGDDDVDYNNDIYMIRHTMRVPIFCWNDFVNDGSVVDLGIIIPHQLPNYPEFRDEQGNTLYVQEFRTYYNFIAPIHRKFVTDAFENISIRDEKVRKHTNAQCKAIKEELMINRWSPTRVEKLLLAGYDIEDM